MRPPPSRDQVRQWLKCLADGEISPDEASSLAHPWVTERELEITDPISTRGLERLLGADLPSTDRPKLYGPEDFIGWLADFDELAKRSGR